MVVGLGNPGPEYAETRHNVGFAVLDRLAHTMGLAFKRERKWEAEVTKTEDGLLLIKPQTYMNLSGRAVAKAARFFKLPAREILIVVDDVALPLGRLRLRQSGGDGGHNGLRSLIQELGTREFPRLRLGIGDVPGARMTGHVLGRFRPEEREAVEKALATAVEAVQVAVSQGVSKAANTFNVREQPSNPNQDEPQIRKPDCSEHQGE